MERVDFAPYGWQYSVSILDVGALGWFKYADHLNLQFPPNFKADCSLEAATAPTPPTISVIRRSRIVRPLQIRIETKQSNVCFLDADHLHRVSNCDSQLQTHPFEARLLRGHLRTWKLGDDSIILSP